MIERIDADAPGSTGRSATPSAGALDQWLPGWPDCCASDAIGSLSVRGTNAITGPTSPAPPHPRR